jgi:hypothetical protein
MGAQMIDPANINSANMNAANTNATAPPVSTQALQPEQLAQLKSQLRDIQLPTTVDWWPPAPGWWLLMFIMLGAGIGIYFALQPRLRRKRLNKYLTEQIKTALRAYREDKAAAPAIRVCAELLRRVCLTYFPRSTVAGLSGQAWLDFLEAHGPEGCFKPSSTILLTEMRFSDRPPSHKVIEQLFRDTNRWVTEFDPKSERQSSPNQQTAPQNPKKTIKHASPNNEKKSPKTPLTGAHSA